MKKIIFLLMLVLGIAFLAGCGTNNTSSDNNPVDENASIIFFYGQECPHCQKVEQFISDNKVADKVQFSQAEVYHNKANAEIMKKKAEACGLDVNKLGVPMLWADGKCLVGDQDVTKFFQDKINQ